MIHKTSTRLILGLTLVLASGMSIAATAQQAEDDSGDKSSKTDQFSIETQEMTDPFQWLEEVDGERAMKWVHAQNKLTAQRLESNPDFSQLLEQAKAALDNDSRIPNFTQRGDYLYEFWKDEKNPRGLYRRMKLSDLRSDSPKWETVLDVDALGKDEKKTWVFKGMNCHEPEYKRCLVSLSPGGGDAVEVREFNLETLEFIDGFFLPTAKNRLDWIDENTLFVGTDFGPGSMTDSGYPRTARRWKRGTPLSEASLVFEGDAQSVSASASHYEGDENTPDIEIVSEALTFWTSAQYQLLNGKLHSLSIPETASFSGVWQGRVLIRPQEEWTIAGRTFPSGSLLIADPSLLRGEKGAIDTIFEPEDGIVLRGVASIDAGIYVTVLDEVKGRLLRFESSEDGGFRSQTIEFPDHGSLSISTVDEKSGDAFVVYQSFVTPPTLYHLSGATAKATKVRSQEPTFDGSKIEVHQYWTKSADGTRVPYFVVAKKGTPRDGKNPTHIFSYGGFRNALTPSYSGSYEQLYGAYGQMWLERGGVFVLANIRGGGEFGPSWHQAALKENRYLSYEDFEAIAHDLEVRKITNAKQIGIEGRSNGGLLVSATFTRRPDLYGAVICGVPLADMQRYHKLLAGASWMAEYGNPDIPEEWEYIKEYSPYHNLHAEKDYPAVFYYTSTRDDRVHPGHARKMAAKMIDLGYEVWYYENTEGGHGGSTTNDQLAYRLALAYSHLWSQLGGDSATPEANSSK